MPTSDTDFCRLPLIKELWTFTSHCIAKQDIDLLVPRHLQHVGQTGAGAHGLGHKPCPQRMPADRFGIKPDPASIFLDKPRNRAIGHWPIGKHTLRVDLQEQRPPRPEPPARR